MASTYMGQQQRVPVYNPFMTPTNTGIPPIPPQQKPIKLGFYEIEHTIGKGNNACVKLARHRITKTEVAIKIIDKRRLDEENLKKAYREIQMLKKVKHPHLLKLYQVLESQNMIYLVTEYAKNGEMFDFIAQKKKLSEDAAREKFWQIISAVDYLHKNKICHRDLKAENLLLDSNYDIKLADFGFSNFYEKDSLLNTYCGSPPYAAPEIFEGREYIGPQVDIWSLGVVLYVLVCGVLPFEGANLQILRDRVLSGRIRIPFFLSQECENLIRRMLTLDPTKRPTIDQIKKHKWMKQQEMEPKLRSLSNLYYMDLEEPQPQIIRLMQTLGVEASRVKSSIMNDAYDNFHGIYLLLLDRLRGPNTTIIHTPNNNNGSTSSSGVSSILPTKVITSTVANSPVPVVESRSKRRQSDAPRPRPPLNTLREHSTFQTTDCISNLPTINSHAVQYAHSDYEENCSTLSRQSTIGTIGSVDEGVESDPNGSRFSSSEIENGSGNSLLVVNNSPFNSHNEIDLMSSLNSCPNSEGHTGVCCSNQVTNTTLTKTSNSNENSPCTSPARKDFKDGWHVSDNAMFDSLAFTGNLNTKCRANDAINAQPSRPIPNIQRRVFQQTGAVPKLISLTENLEFQPQVLLNLKQSINVEKQLVGDNSTNVEPKQVLKVRLQQQQQKRLTKARMQIFRQQSYQLAQRQSVIPANMMNLRIDDSPIQLPLSPIEDLMDTS